MRPSTNDASRFGSSMSVFARSIHTLTEQKANVKLFMLFALLLLKLGVSGKLQAVTWLTKWP